MCLCTVRFLSLSETKEALSNSEPVIIKRASEWVRITSTYKKASSKSQFLLFLLKKNLFHCHYFPVQCTSGFILVTAVFVRLLCCCSCDIKICIILVSFRPLPSEHLLVCFCYLKLVSVKTNELHVHEFKQVAIKQDCIFIRVA